MKHITHKDGGISERMEVPHNKAALSAVDNAGIPSALEKLMVIKAYRAKSDKINDSIAASGGDFFEMDTKPASAVTAADVADIEMIQAADVFADDVFDADPIAGLDTSTTEEAEAAFDGSFDLPGEDLGDSGDPFAGFDINHTETPSVDSDDVANDIFGDFGAASSDTVDSPVDTPFHVGGIEPDELEDVSNADLFSEETTAIEDTGFNPSPSPFGDDDDIFGSSSNSAADQTTDTAGDDLFPDFGGPVEQEGALSDQDFAALDDLDDSGHNDKAANGGDVFDSFFSDPVLDSGSDDVMDLGDDAPASNKEVTKAADLPDGWEVGESDPNSATKALFAADEDADEVTGVATALAAVGDEDEDNKGKRKKGVFSMFGKKKGAASSKTKKEPQVTTDEDLSFDDGDALLEEDAPKKGKVKAVKAKGDGSKTKRILLMTTAGVGLIGAAAFGAMMFLSQPTTTVSRPSPSQQAAASQNSMPVLTPNAPSADAAPAGQLGLPGQPAAPAVVAPEVTAPAAVAPTIVTPDAPTAAPLGLPGDSAPSADPAPATAPLGLPGDSAPAENTGFDAGAFGVSVTPDAQTDAAAVMGAPVAAGADVVQLRSELDAMAIRAEEQSETIEKLESHLETILEALQLRDSAIAAQDGRIQEALTLSQEARRTAEDQNQILIEFAHTREEVAQGIEITSDLSRRVGALESTNGRVDDLNREVAQMRRDIGALVRATLDTSRTPRVITQDVPPQVPPAPASGEVYNMDNTTPLALPGSVNVPPNVKVGDTVEGGGMVLDIVELDGGGKLVIMETAQVRID